MRNGTTISAGGNDSGRYGFATWLRLKNVSRSARVFLSIILPAGIVLAGLYMSGYRVNITSSMPVGIYRVDEGTPERGDYVAYCPVGATAALALDNGWLRPGSCNAGTRPLLKILAGVAGDTVRLDADGILINGVLQPCSAARSADKNGIALTRHIPEETVPTGMAFLLARHEGSYDSRYFGPVPASGLSKVVPVMLF
jgi:conjugative transfer signal peptidase TraF